MDKETMDKEKTKKVKKHPKEKTLLFPIAPKRQFRRLVAVASFLLIILVSAHVYLFYGMESGDIFKKAQNIELETPSINQAKLDAVLERYSEKASQRSQIGTLVPTVPEPSEY